MQDLLSSLKSEVGGKTGDLVQAMLKSPAEFDAWSIYHATKGLGTTDSTLVEIICTRSNEEIAALKEAFKRRYKKDLEKVVISETSGNFKRLLVSLLQGGRNESTEVDEELAEKEAKLLHKSTKGWFTDNSSLNQVLALRSPAQLRATCNAYLSISGRDLTHTLKRRLSKDLAKGLLLAAQAEGVSE
mgnify:CR=1 FL=1